MFEDSKIAVMCDFGGLLIATVEPDVAPTEKDFILIQLTLDFPTFPVPTFPSAFSVMLSTATRPRLPVWNSSLLRT